MNSPPNLAQYIGLIPSRSRTSVSVRSFRSQMARANIPIRRSTVGRTPTRETDSRMTSVSE